MNSYLVEWRIDIDADTPEEAAAKVLIIQRDNDSLNSAVVFHVTDKDGDEHVVDLLEDQE